jgi:hypothetical protein
MKKSILDFFEENKSKLSTRLRNWFLNERQYYFKPNIRYNPIDLSKPIKDLTKKEFISRRNMGNKSWEELQKLYKELNNQTTMKSLYQISREAMEIASQLEEGELTPEMETALAINQNELQEKAINYGYAIKSMEDDVTAINEEIKRLQAIKTAKSNAIDRMKEAVSNAMQVYGIEKVTSPTLNLSFRKSEVVEVELVEALSNDFKIVKTTVTADKVAIKQAIKQGENITGARIVQKFNLQIK